MPLFSVRGSAWAPRDSSSPVSSSASSSFRPEITMATSTQSPLQVALTTNHSRTLIPPKNTWSWFHESTLSDRPSLTRIIGKDIAGLSRFELHHFRFAKSHDGGQNHMKTSIFRCQVSAKSDHLPPSHISDLDFYDHTAYSTISYHCCPWIIYA